MVKFLLRLLLVVYILTSTPITYCDSNYARILNSQTYLYRSANEDKSLKNMVCILEKTYYVEILMIYDEDFYKRKVEIKMTEEKKLLEKGDYEDECEWLAHN